MSLDKAIARGTNYETDAHTTILQKVFLREIVTPTHRAVVNGGDGIGSGSGCYPFPDDPPEEEMLTSIELYSRSQNSAQDALVRVVQLDFDDDYFHRYDGTSAGSQIPPRSHRYSVLRWRQGGRARLRVRVPNA